MTRPGYLKPRARTMALLALALAPAALAVPAAAGAATPLHGTLAIAPGRYVPARKGLPAHYTGSYFRMLLPGVIRNIPPAI